MMNCVVDACFYVVFVDMLYIEPVNIVLIHFG
jgi:hypothetical protein